ncbi:hypothetical protein E2C01_035407 [Portunus trituberculatus]|uniref:Uncharacterized protein n=1 Tax=Portunus trituberculatus TaxID=210409 RepID=A0A5B7F445_PORTR|nr:hypothetical protein [Portunus trituberculatus]
MRRRAGVPAAITVTGGQALHCPVSDSGDPHCGVRHVLRLHHVFIPLDPWHAGNHQQKLG